MRPGEPERWRAAAESGRRWEGCSAPQQSCAALHQPLRCSSARLLPCCSATGTSCRPDWGAKFF